MENKSSEMSYCVYKFMTEKLGLRLKELLVFAVIYSFTTGPGGVYFGTQEYLAHSTAGSVSTVKRCLASLLKKGYIEALTVDGRKAYRSTVDAKTAESASRRKADTDGSVHSDDTARRGKGDENAPAHEASANKRERTAQKAHIEITAAPLATEKDASKKSEPCKSASTALRGEFDLADCLPPEDEPPKYTFHTVGINEIVQMTPEQYKSLLTLVEPEVLTAYTRRLELLIRDKGYRTFNPYKTVKRWITEDSGV